MSYGADKQVMIHKHTDTWTDTQMQAMTIPEGQNWPHIQTQSFSIVTIHNMEWNISTDKH